MEIYYRKYAQTYKYRILRSIDDHKFKKRRKAQMKGKPKPVFVAPNRTPEEQKAIDTEMKRLYKEYHVSAAEHFRRWVAEQRRLYDFSHKNKQAEEERKLLAKLANGGKEMPEQEDNNSDSTARKIANIITTVILIAAMIFTAYVMICAARNKAVNVFGKSILKVVTGSMEPSIHVGDYIVVEKTDPAQLQKGDVIAFYSEQSDIYGMLVTHRIAEITEDNTFITRGDANPVNDSVAVREDRIVGKYTGKARFFIWVNSFASPQKILMIFVIIPVGLICIYELKTLAKLGKEVSETNTLTREERKQQLIREAIEKEKQRLADEGYQSEENSEEVTADEPREDNEA